MGKRIQPARTSVRSPTDVCQVMKMNRAQTSFSMQEVQVDASAWTLVSQCRSLRSTPIHGIPTLADHSYTNCTALTVPLRVSIHFQNGALTRRGKVGSSSPP